MKKILFYYFIVMITTSCKSQQKIIDLKSKDILVFNLYNDSIHFINSNYNQNTNLSNHNIMITQNWSGYGSHYFNKEYIFYKDKDTMNIKCFCGQERNYYFKNLGFKKGNYELKFKMPKKSTIGSKIETAKEVQDIIFKNTYVSDENPTQKDKYFKDLKFIEIDLNDTINVKLTEIKTSANN